MIPVGFDSSQNHQYPHVITARWRLKFTKAISKRSLCVDFMTIVYYGNDKPSIHPTKQAMTLIWSALLIFIWLVVMGQLYRRD